MEIAEEKRHGTFFTVFQYQKNGAFFLSELDRSFKAPSNS